MLITKNRLRHSTQIKMKNVRGTEGYAEAKQKFIEATLSIDFHELHKDFIAFFPDKGRILDIGAGIGRDASVFTQMGYSVTAIEPVEEFRNIGKELYNLSDIKWVDDALPELRRFGNKINYFDFILVSGMWHHLNYQEQYFSLKRITELLSLNGILALTLRNGPAGIGTRIFPINVKQTIKDAEYFGLSTMLFLENQPSLMKNKEHVFWAKVVFQKRK